MPRGSLARKRGHYADAQPTPRPHDDSGPPSPACRLGGGLGNGLMGAFGSGDAHRAKPLLAGVRTKEEKSKGPVENAAET